MGRGGQVGEGALVNLLWVVRRHKLFLKMSLVAPSKWEVNLFQKIQNTYKIRCTWQDTTVFDLISLTLHCDLFTMGDLFLQWIHVIASDYAPIRLNIQEDLGSFKLIFFVIKWTKEYYYCEESIANREEKEAAIAQQKQQKSWRFSAYFRCSIIPICSISSTIPCISLVIVTEFPYVFTCQEMLLSFLSQLGLDDTLKCVSNDTFT